jgi:VCBS repeat protein
MNAKRTSTTFRKSTIACAAALCVLAGIVPARAQTMYLAKEYIRVNGRVIAVDQPPAATQQLMIWNSSTDYATADYFNGAGRATSDGSATLNSGSQLNGWNVVGMADFNGDGVLDLVWQNTSTGQVNVNYYNAGNTLTGYAVLNSGSGTSGWSVVAVADVDGNGTPDLIWQDHSTGQVNVNYYGGSGGATMIGWAELNSGSGTSGWHVVSAADFDGNGTPDLVWQNTSTGQVNVNYYTYVNSGTSGVTLTGYAVLNSGAGTSGWQLVGAADFDGNGVPDLVWQQTATGLLHVNYYGGVGGAALQGWASLGSQAVGVAVIVPYVKG